MGVGAATGDGAAGKAQAQDGAATPVPGGRRADLDRLRVLACLSTFCYHPMTVFDLGTYSIIKSQATSVAFDVASRLLHIVRMPLFFLIAGMVGALSMRRLGDRAVLRVRAQRLLLPFLVGVVLFAPAIKYFELLEGRSVNWRGVAAMTGPPPDVLVFLRRFFTQLRWFSWAHLWFLVYLFLIGAALLPAMRRIEGARWSWPLPMALAPLVMLAAFVAVEWILRPIFPHHLPNIISDWASIAIYGLVMLGGAGIVRFPELEAVLQRGVAMLAVGLIAGVACFLAGDGVVVGGFGRALTLWSVLGLAVGLGPWLQRGRLPGERYLAEAVLPLYVLHLLPLVVIAHVVKDAPWPVWLRYWVIVVPGFTVTLGLYHLLVRPFGPMRVAFGLPRAPRSND